MTQTAHVPETDCGNIAQTNLVAAAQAVLDRWNSPQWEWVKDGPTGDLMQVLRAALDAQFVYVAPESIMQPVQPDDKDRVLNGLRDAFMQTAPGAVLMAIGNALQYIDSLDITIAQPVPPDAVSTPTVTYALIRLRFFRDLTGDERFNVLQVFGAMPAGVTADDMSHFVEGRLFDKAFAALKAQPVEPVAWRRVNPHTGFDYVEHQNALNGMTNPNWQALYATPPAVSICETLQQYFAKPTINQNFCPRCGKRLGGTDEIHTCTPPVQLKVEL